ncbi:MAG: hypothetical protein U0791_02655 [Gemmataceae bacterium]
MATIRIHGAHAATKPKRRETRRGKLAEQFRALMLTRAAAFSLAEGFEPGRRETERRETEEAAYVVADECGRRMLAIAVEYFTEGHA